jgi:hypothetical protein
MKLHLIAAMAAVLVAGVVQAGEGGCPLSAKKTGEGCSVKADAAATADATAKKCCGKEGCKAAAKDKDAAKCGGTCPKKDGDKAEAPAAEEPKPADAGEKKDEAPAEKPAEAPAAE